MKILSLNTGRVFLWLTLLATLPLPGSTDPPLGVNCGAWRLAVQDLVKTYPHRYAKGRGLEHGK